MIEALLQRFRGKDRLALARLLSLAARGEGLAEIAAGLGPPTSPSRVVAFTGSGGVGKSTLVGKMIDLARGQGKTVAVLACDPQSPVSGGALLGDRFRMGGRLDDGVFIRSLAALAGHGALAEHLPLLIRLLEAFGFEWIFLETAGAGQGDTAVRDHADVVVLLLQPETGDDLQWEKAGVLEVADVIVIHKADLPGADQVAAQVRACIDLSGPARQAGPMDSPARLAGSTDGGAMPVLLVSSKTGAGLEKVWQEVTECSRRRGQPDPVKELLGLAREALASRLHAAENDPQWQALVQQWCQGTFSSKEAGEAVLGFLARSGR